MSVSHLPGVAGLACLLSVTSGEAWASDGPYGFGLGVVAGEPSGIALSYRPGDRWMLQATAGRSLARDRFHLHVDYVYNITVIEAPSRGRVSFPIYVGGGLRTHFGNADASDSLAGLGVRLPLGITVLPDRTPFDIFVEIAPAALLLPTVEGGLDYGIGARFYF